jgi:hypothetical protein
VIDFILWLAATALPGILLLVVWLRAIYRKLQDLPLSVPALVIQTLLLGAGLFLAGRRLVGASVSVLREGAAVVRQEGPELAREAIASGTRLALEGMGRTMDHFEAKWDAAAHAQAAMLEPDLLSARIRTRDGARELELSLSLRNTGTEAIDLAALIRRQILLLRDTKGLHYPLKPPAGETAGLPPGQVSGRVLRVVLPDGVEPAALVLPGKVARINLSSP